MMELLQHCLMTINFNHFLSQQAETSVILKVMPKQNIISQGDLLTLFI